VRSVAPAPGLPAAARPGEAATPEPVLSAFVDTLQGKVAVVTGGASGIGLAAARLLANEGASVLVVDRDGDGAHDAAADIGGSALLADVSRSEEWHRIVSAARDMGGADVAYLNAGVTTGVEDIASVTDEQYQRILGVNVGGVVYGTRALVPEIASRGGGAIVATSSLAGIVAFPGDPLYTLTKHAIVGFVRSLGPRLAEKNVTINAVCPGLVNTPMIDGEIREALAGSGFPLIAPESVAEAVIGCMLGSATGQAIVVQSGREPVAYRFGRPPGPREPGAGSKIPPGWLADQSGPAQT
jgi:NAD(P)-dependent dehydrogenase (short-subunit alcohol dehydrogenase family)